MTIRFKSLLVLTFACYSLDVGAVQSCRSDTEIPKSTPNQQLIDNGNGTVTDNSTGLTWKKCAEGLSGSSCDIGSIQLLTWEAALQRSDTVNSAGFAGFTDWRLPNMKELQTIVEAQCTEPSIDLARFPNTPVENFWSSTPYSHLPETVRGILLDFGRDVFLNRDDSYAVRLVRGQ